MKLTDWMLWGILLAVCFCREACAQSLELHEAVVSDSAATQTRLAVAKLADQRLAEQLQTVIAQGRIRHIVYVRDLNSPTITLDADVQVFYDAPKFQLHLQYATDLAEGLTEGETSQKSSDEKKRVLVTEQTLLFDGYTLTKVQRSSDGTCRGDIYFDFHRPNMLRMAGFPFENPVELWREPLQIDRADLLNAHITPLTAGGFVGTLNKDTYRLKFYFLGSFDYDLRRVSSTRIGQETPFRDWHLSWQIVDGVPYVERLVRRSNTVSGENEPLGLTDTVREQIELEYSHFSLSSAIDPLVFELSGLDLPESTPFYDHRTNVNGKPKLVWWQHGQLRDIR
ncbi:MAG: hypothetical protein ABI557_19485 [Aureliella sp.]